MNLASKNLDRLAPELLDCAKRALSFDHLDNTACLSVDAPGPQKNQITKVVKANAKMYVKSDSGKEPRTSVCTPTCM